MNQIKLNVKREIEKKQKKWRPFPTEKFPSISNHKFQGDPEHQNQKKIGEQSRIQQQTPGSGPQKNIDGHQSPDQATGNEKQKQPPKLSPRKRRNQQKHTDPRSRRDEENGRSRTKNPPRSRAPGQMYAADHEHQQSRSGKENHIQQVVRPPRDNRSTCLLKKRSIVPGGQPDAFSQIEIEQQP